MTTTVTVTFGLGSPSQCKQTLSDLFSAVSYVRHKKAAKIECVPGNGPFRQLLVIHMLEEESDRSAGFIADEIVCRVVNRTKGGLNIMRRNIDGVAA